MDKRKVFNPPWSICLVSQCFLSDSWNILQIIHWSKRTICFAIGDNVWARFWPMPDTVWRSDSVAHLNGLTLFFAGAGEVAGLSELSSAGTSSPSLTHRSLLHRWFCAKLTGGYCICCHPACLINSIVDSAIGALKRHFWKTGAKTRCAI